MKEKLILKSVETTAVLVPLKRPVVSKVGLYEHWPLILIDLYTEKGIVGRSYLEPYLKQSTRYIIPAIHDLVAARKGQRIAPLDNWQRDRVLLNLVGYGGISMITVSGLDMAAWDALAKAAGLPLAVYLGGSLGPVLAYNSNGLWLTPVDTLAPGRVCRAAPQAQDADSARRELLRTTGSVPGDHGRRGRLRHARSDAHRRCHRMASLRTDRGCGRNPGLHASLPGGLGPSDTRDRERALAGVAGLGGFDPRATLRGTRRRHLCPQRSGERHCMERRRGAQVSLRRLIRAAEMGHFDLSQPGNPPSP